ncbi:MAG: PAS domain-containing sensor histidine kinase [Bacteroidia bacterium]|nr:PAS domain-containing sensor histidine kinase [Bacteroidia bacterium]
MNIDIRTLGFVICLVDLLLVVIFILQFRTNKNFEGPGWWVLGLVSTSIGIFLMLLRNFIENKLLSIILANILLVLGGILIYTGVMRFLGKRENIKVLLLIMLLLIIGLAGYTYALDDISIRIAIVSATLALLSFMTARAMFLNKTAAIRNSVNFSCLVLAGFSLIFLIRAADALFFTYVDNLFSQGWFQLYGFMTILITHVLLVFGLIFIQLCYQVVNKAQAAFFGKKRSDLLGKSDYELMPEDSAENCHRTDQEVLDSGQTKINCEKVGNSIYETRKFPVQLINGKMGVGAFIRDITEARRAEEALTREQYLMNALMNNLPDHIYFKDKESRFIRINKAHSESFGLCRPGEELGKTDFDFFTEEHARQAYKDEQTIILSGKPFVQEERETRANRPDTWVSTIKLPLLNHEGTIIGTFGISRDITEWKRAAAEIELKNKQLEQMNAEKDKLFSIIAHDLRSPFNALLGLTGLMTDDSEMLTLEDMRKAAGIVRKSANSLNNQLGNLLEWSRIQMNFISINPVLQNLKLAVDTELELFTEAAQLKQIRLINSIPEAIPVTADNQMLHSILRNLISNAIKFTKPGGQVSLTAKRQTDDFVEISVRDTGIGMSPDILGRLFILSSEVYRRGTEGEPSSGLGLIICKELVEKQGGRIWTESGEGVGSTFRFTMKS